tara:strand:+ start:2668 stop:3360 length:693 start_codon:yes stop_codon:yes gene_type:complete
MAEDQYDKLMDFPTDVQSYQFQNKFGFYPHNLPSGEMAFEDSKTPTRDKFVGYLEKKLPTEKYGNLLGGQGQGFLDMGLADAFVVPSFLDSYDAHNRLEETKRTDNFSNTTDLAMAQLPFALKVAAILDPNTNAIKDYYDGKKMDLVTMYAPMLGFSGVSFLAKFGRAASKAPVIGQFVNKMFPTGALPASYDMVHKVRAQNPDAAIKGDKFANIFNLNNQRYVDEIYDE